MRTPFIAAALLAAAWACDSGTEPVGMGDCVAALKLDGATYVATWEELPTSFTPDDAYATVTANKGCNDVIEVKEDGSIVAPDTLVNGESNFLPAGTRLFILEGTPPAPPRLAARSNGEWFVLVREPFTAFVFGDIRVALTLEPASVDAPDTAVATLTYTNLADAETTFTSSMGCLAFTGVFQDTTRIPFPATDYACTAAIREWTLGPGETLENRWSLEIGDGGVPLDPGTYRFEAALNTGGWTLVRYFQVF